MYTLCPHCSTCFRITTEQVNAAQGNVRCGNCGAVFNALDNPGPEPDSFSDSIFAEIEPFSTDEPKPADAPSRLQDDKHEQDETYKLFREADFIPLGEAEESNSQAGSHQNRQLQIEEEEAALAEAEIISSRLSETVIEDIHEHFVQEVDDSTIEELEKLFLPDDDTETKPTHETSAPPLPKQKPLKHRKRKRH